MIATSRDPSITKMAAASRVIGSVGRCPSTSATTGGDHGPFIVRRHESLSLPPAASSEKPGAVPAASGIFSPAPHLSRNSAGFCYHLQRGEAMAVARIAAPGRFGDWISRSVETRAGCHQQEGSSHPSGFLPSGREQLHQRSTLAEDA